MGPLQARCEPAVGDCRAAGAALVSAHDPHTPHGRMTALVKYDRLESLGLWRDTVQARGRDVVVGFRDATLVLSDPKSDLALTHWSLPAVQRLNPGALPALYAPGLEGNETLEIDDPNMIAALDTVSRALLRRRARPGRLRALILTAGVMGTLALGLFWMPDALVAHTASVLPAVSRAEIGRTALTELTRLTGPPCGARPGTLAASKLATRLFAAEPATILVMGDGLEGSLALPGELILLGHGVVETAPDAGTIAGHALAAAVEAELNDPIIPLLQHAGVPATLRLLTTGHLPETALQGYAEVLLRRRPGLPVETLLQRFQAAGVPTSPYAYSLDPTGETVLGLIEADPYRGVKSKPVLGDADWAGLQAICAD